MGYTTEFKGRFHCHRVESKELGIFLKTIREGDRSALGPLADWLLERGDSRGEKIAALVKQPSDSLEAFWLLFGLKPEHTAYLIAFRDSRRMKRDAKKAQLFPDPIREAVGLPLGEEAGYFVAGKGFMGQDRDESVVDGNKPPKGQPGLWCQWIPNDSGTAIVWDGQEKFYDYVEWLQYLIKHFLAPWGYVLNGEMKWQGEDRDDHGTIFVDENAVDACPDAGGEDWYDEAFGE